MNVLRNKETESPYGFRRNTESPYGFRRNTESPYGFRRNTESPYGLRRNTESPYGFRRNRTIRVVDILDMLLLLALIIFASALRSRTERLQNITLYLEVAGKISLSPGVCRYPDPTLPMLQCNITKELPYLQIKGGVGSPPGVAFSSTSKELESNGGYQYIGAMTVAVSVNRFAGTYEFGVSGMIPPIDDNTLQIEFRLGHSFE